MTITLDVSSTTERRLKERARREGKEVPALIGDLIERELDAVAKLDAILGPFRRQVAESGITDDELTDVFNEARRNASAARKY